jgi:carbonic anhydrase
MKEQQQKFSQTPAKNPSQKLSPDDALARLKEGNHRFSQGLRSIDTLINRTELKNLAEQGQNPIAIILTCSDSRAPTETLFDCGLGSLYVLRVAGNALSEVFLAGIEYAVTYFNTPLILVLGHTQCGAIAAAFDQLKHPEKALPTPSLEILVHEIARDQKDVQDPDELGLKNIARQVERIPKESQIVSEKIKSGKLKIRGALYNISTGVVEFTSSTIPVRPKAHLP